MSDYYVIGKIENNKIYYEYFRQGNIYKNEFIFQNTINLSDEEIDKLPLKDKICYVPENSFGNKDYIELGNTLEDGNDYYTVKSIKEDIKTYFGEDIIKKITNEDMKSMIIDVFDVLDWQHPSFLLDGDSYLDAFMEDKLKSSLESEIDYDF